MLIYWMWASKGSKKINPVTTLDKICATLAMALTVFSSTVQADWADVHCDVYRLGEDHASAATACMFCRSQAHINIDQPDGISDDLSPEVDLPAARRNSPLGKDGLIFQFPNETMYVYRNTATAVQPGTDGASSHTAVYSKANYDATTCKFCSLNGQVQLTRVTAP